MCVYVCVTERERQTEGDRLSPTTVLLETSNIYRYDSLLIIINLKMVYKICPEMSPSDSTKVLKR